MGSRFRFAREEVLVAASQRPGKSKAAEVSTRSRGSFCLFALLPSLIVLVIPAAACADIYKWTDEQGRTNFSNIPPTTAGKAKNVEVVLKEAKSASIPQHVATPTEQALLARIENLERELRNRQYATQAPAAPPPTPSGSYYPPPPLPPSTTYYGSGYSSYPSYYPNYYYPVATSYVVYPARTYYSRPAYVAPSGGFAHAGGGHGGHRGRR